MIATKFSAVNFDVDCGSCFAIKTFYCKQYQIEQSYIVNIMYELCSSDLSGINIFVQNIS